MEPYERFEAWRLCHALAVSVHRATVAWPVAERYSLTAQARRAAFAVPTNIAEGSARRGRAEFARFLSISIASLTELGYLLRLAHDVDVLAAHDWARLESDRTAASKCLWGLYRSVRPR